jgi:hypothetical protein
MADFAQFSRCANCGRHRVSSRFMVHPPALPPDRPGRGRGFARLTRAPSPWSGPPDMLYPLLSLSRSDHSDFLTALTVDDCALVLDALQGLGVEMAERISQVIRVLEWQAGLRRVKDDGWLTAFRIDDRPSNPIPFDGVARDHGCGPFIGKRSIEP